MKKPHTYEKNIIHFKKPEQINIQTQIDFDQIEFFLYQTLPQF